VLKSLRSGHAMNASANRRQLMPETATQLRSLSGFIAAEHSSPAKTRKISPNGTASLSILLPRDALRRIAR
jgi:hypothetical protein